MASIESTNIFVTNLVEGGGGLSTFFHPSWDLCLVFRARMEMKIGAFCFRVSSWREEVSLLTGCLDSLSSKARGLLSNHVWIYWAETV